MATKVVPFLPRVLAMLLALSMALTSGSVFAQQDGSGDDASDAAEEGSSKGIEIDVTVGVQRKLIPLAVPDVKEPGGDTGEVADQVEQILRRDLELSGFFKLLPNDSFFFDPSKEGMGASQIKFQNWFNVGAQGLIKSAVRTNDDKVVLDLRLYGVEQGKQAKLNWSGGAVAKDEVAKKVHDFANAVLEYYTGKPGVFGSRIAYTRRSGKWKQIYVTELGSEKATRVSKPNTLNNLPSWAGGTLYFTSWQHNNPDLWAYRGGKRTKFSSQQGQNSGAAYCGGKMAVTLSMGENTDIYLLDPESGDIQKRLTKHWSIDTSPTWSPDCSKIAFQSGRAGKPQIYVMNADGSSKRRLTFQGSYNTEPSWSPQGDVIAFSARDERNAYDIFTVDLQGNIERLTQDQGNNAAPSYSPDGRYIAFESTRGGKGRRIWVMTSDGEVQHPITEGSGYESPAWER